MSGYGWALLLPIAAAVLRGFKEWFALNVIISGSCAAIVMGARGGFSPLAAGLLLSVAADWFMAHKGNRTNWYLCGIGGFFVAHGLFLWDVLTRFTPAPLPFWAFGGMAVLFSIYLLARVIPRLQDGRMRVAVFAYMLISAASFGLSFGAGNWVYTLGIGMIVVSDALIAETDFAGNRAVAPAILPTYFSCHILLALSAVLAGKV